MFTERAVRPMAFLKTTIKSAAASPACLALLAISTPVTPRSGLLVLVRRLASAPMESLHALLRPEHQTRSSEILLIRVGLRRLSALGLWAEISSTVLVLSRWTWAYTRRL